MATGEAVKDFETYGKEIRVEVAPAMVEKHRNYSSCIHFPKVGPCILRELILTVRDINSDNLLPPYSDKYYGSQAGDKLMGVSIDRNRGELTVTIHLLKTETNGKSTWNKVTESLGEPARITLYYQPQKSS